MRFTRSFSSIIFDYNFKVTAYLTIVRPIMEYAADIWDPIHQSNIQQLEKVQPERLDGS